MDIARLLGLHSSSKMASMNPACYLPSALSVYIPKALQCPPPQTYLGTLYSTIISPMTSTYAALSTVTNSLGGLPFLSFLLIPTMTSYSTSLNLLFFYLTWATLVLSHPPLRIEFLSTLAIRVLFYVLPSLFFLGFDTLLPSAAENLKAHGSSALPLKNPTRNRALRTLRIISWSILNVILSSALLTLIEYTLTEVLSSRSSLRVTTSLPLPWQIVKDLLRGYLVREITTYILHRYILHESSTILAHYHNTWYHSLSAPFPLSATYDHPLAYLIRSFIPTFLPAYLFRFHLLTYLLYLTIISLEETFAYSGYSTVPTNFILGGVARRTDDHLVCDGEGNFGNVGLVDWVMGTTIGRDLMQDVEVEAERRGMQESFERARSKDVEGVKQRLNGNGNGNGYGKDGVRRTSARRKRSAD